MAKYPNLKIGDRIEIYWLDSASASGWSDETAFQTEHGSARIKSTGYFLGITNDSVQLVGDRQYNEGYTPRINRGISIPVGCIEKILKLRS